MSNSHVSLLSFAVVLALFSLGRSAPDRQSPGGLDPETWEKLRRAIDQGNPKADPETKREILKRIEETPKVRCGIESVTVYADGIVYRGWVASSLPADCRVDTVGLSLCLVRKARLADRNGNEWSVPPLVNHYHYLPLTEEWTLLVPRGKSVRFEQVDRLEAPRLVAAKRPAAGPVPQPGTMTYTVARYSTAYSADLKEDQTVYFVGRGKMAVRWTTEPAPKCIKVRVIDEAVTK